MIEVKNVGKPDDRREFPHGHLDFAGGAAEYAKAASR